jgi:protease-4
MKGFLSSLAGTLVGLIVFSVGIVLLAAGAVAALVALGGRESAVPAFDKGSYLVLDLSTNVTDAPASLDLGAFGGGRESLQLRTITRALRAAARDERIAGVFLTGDLSPADFGSGYAALQELRSALADFRAAGKPIQAYLTQAGTRTYYVASVADNVALDPYGMLLMPGLASQPVFFAGLFEKYGVNVQVTRVGKYKSAVETFTRRDMSPENREEVSQLLGDIWRELIADVARSRGIETAAVQAVVDREGLIRAEPALAARLIDRVAYRDEIYEDLKSKTGRAGSREPFRQVALAQYAKQLKDGGGSEPGRKSGGKGRIAVVYAEGEIVDGEGSPGEIGASELSRTLRKIRQDPNVKAVVLRVNSPGGSASAAEVIQREVRLIKAAKPIVVSMGSYAASGGYWIAAPADRIFAEATTITGSIGVFGLQFDVQRLAGDFGVTFDSVKTGRFADALTIARPKNAEELAVLQRMVDWIYGEFVAKVAEGRGLTAAQVEEVAQGRVWSGREALARGLVDEVGGLEAAVAHAAKRAGLGEAPRVTEYPRSKELLEQLQELLERKMPGAARSAAGPLGALFGRMEAELRVLRSFNDPHGVYARLPLSIAIR